MSEISIDGIHRLQSDRLSTRWCWSAGKADLAPRANRGANQMSDIAFR